MLDPSVHANRAAVERHHLFPKAHLRKLAITDTRDTNQIANYALLEWGDNSDISDTPPAEYLPVMRGRVTARDLERMYYWHALPDAWETMDYQTFLAQRRDRIAQVIKDGYVQLSADQALAAEPVRLNLKILVAAGEGTTTEFKATLRVNLHTHQPDSRMELGCLKTIAGFLNSNGGTLLVGVTDDGEPVGIPEADKFPDEDKMILHLVCLVTSRIGAPYMMYVHPRFEDFEKNRVMAIECWPAKSPVFVKDGSNERFFVRAGPSTAELPASQMQEYIKLRFG